MFIFCVCSLEPEEGEAQLASLGQAGLSIDPISPDELPAGLRPREDGTLRTLPGQVEGGLDGYFIARMSRTGYSCRRVALPLAAAKVNAMAMHNSVRISPSILPDIGRDQCWARLVNPVSFSAVATPYHQQ